MAVAAISPQGAVLMVSGVLDADSVLALQADGAVWIRSEAPAAFTLDLAAVEYSSSAGLALLLDWLRIAAACGKQVRVSQMPADMRALVRVSGLENLLPVV
jgi:phospholipid transport system transporter-binding protein